MFSPKQHIYPLLLIFFALFLSTFFVPRSTFVSKSTFAQKSFDNETLLPYSFPAEKRMFLYRIDFWLFKNAAKGSLSFEPHHRGVRAVFEAETHGVITIIAGHRREIMESIMEYDHAAQRFRPVAFSESFSQGNRTVKKTLAFDYQSGFYTCVFEQNGKTTLSIKRHLPKDQFEDLLSFLFNLKAGAYGRITTGMVLRPCVLMKDRPSYLTVTFPQAPVRPKLSASRCYVTLSMEPDLTHARSKTVRGWFSEGFIPVEGIVEDAYLFGDLNVILVEEIDSFKRISEERHQ